MEHYGQEGRANMSALGTSLVAAPKQDSAADPWGDTSIRTSELLAEHHNKIYRRTSRLFTVLMLAQWIAGIAAALCISPRTWYGSTSSVHVHVWMAVLLGGAIT